MRKFKFGDKICPRNHGGHKDFYVVVESDDGVVVQIHSANDPTLKGSYDRRKVHLRKFVE